MIDHIAGLIFNDNKELLVLRKNTVGDRKECILPGGKRETGESDEQVLKRELEEELGVEVESFEYYKQYFGKPIYEKGQDFKQTTYITKLVNNDIEVKNEIKEALWINSNFDTLNPVLQNIIPDLVKDGYMVNQNLEDNQNNEDNNINFEAN